MTSYCKRVEMNFSNQVLRDYFGQIIDFFSLHIRLNLSLSNNPQRLLYEGFLQKITIKIFFYVKLKTISSEKKSQFKIMLAIKQNICTNICTQHHKSKYTTLCHQVALRRSVDHLINTQQRKLICNSNLSATHCQLLWRKRKQLLSAIRI